MSAAPAAGDGIDHGTPRGYAQHRQRKVLPPCAQCRAANSTRERQRRQAQKAWNNGATGTPIPGRTVSTGQDCAVSGCGELAAVPRPAARMVRVDWPGSREPARWYCPGACRTYGLALAEVRAIGDRRA
ncbi:hypothetical protein SLA_2390 [Streptomyces laurentii]|uniref:Uncharacterized protein n=1 Tax=Streptomyces laurentii TaxID=39478 RepID=A0A160NX05_STRLU|nr:hypothetical protein SLA_2390 [Streptomyces laurentii]